MKHGNFSLTLALGLALLGAGCSTTVANLDVVSTKTTDFSKPHQRAASQADATDGRLWLTILPLGGAPSIDKAINELLEKHNGDYLTDAKIVDHGWSLLVISYGGIEVKGDVWSTAMPSSTPPVSTPPPAPK